MNTVFSSFLVSISRWGASHNRLSCWAGCTGFRPPAAEIYKSMWQGIASIIPSEKGSLEGTSRAVDLKLVQPRQQSIPRNHRNGRRRYCGWYRQSCIASMSGTAAPHYWISHLSRWRWAWHSGCRGPNTTIWSAFIDRCSRRDRDMLYWRSWCDLWRGNGCGFWLRGGAHCSLTLSGRAWWGFLGCGGGPSGDSSL